MEVTLTKIVHYQESELNGVGVALPQVFEHTPCCY
jgi:hypothetical protein